MRCAGDGLSAGICSLGRATRSPNGSGSYFAATRRRLRRPATLEIMAWETIERNELTSALAALGEARSLAVMETLTDRFATPAGFDAGALGALLDAATDYLLIRSRSIRVFQGVDLGKAAG
jgi:hypothetical protein